MERTIFLFLFTIISVLLDLYFYQIIKKYRFISLLKPLFYVYWLFTVVTVTNLFIYALGINLGFYFKAIIFNMIIGNFISKLVALPFILIWWWPKKESLKSSLKLLFPIILSSFIGIVIERYLFTMKENS